MDLPLFTGTSSVDIVSASLPSAVNLIHSSAGVDDPSQPYKNDARPNSWTPPLNTSWTWGKDRVHGYALPEILEDTILMSMIQRQPWRAFRSGTFYFSGTLSEISWCPGRMGPQHRDGKRHSWWRITTVGGSLQHFYCEFPSVIALMF
jgi:hypothetical protein